MVQEGEIIVHMKWQKCIVGKHGKKKWYAFKGFICKGNVKN